MPTSRLPRRDCAVAVIVLTLMVHAAIASAQSLGDVARREEERRKQTAAPGRVYTNDTLEGVDPVAAEPAVQGGATVPSEPAPKTEVPAYVFQEYLGAGVASEYVVATYHNVLVDDEEVYAPI